MARIAKGFGMDVYAFDEFVPKEKIEEQGVHGVNSRDELFEVCDVVSLHIPATAETRESINYQVVNLMKKGGIVVNTARKEVINEAELIKLLAERDDLKYITDIKPDADEEFRKFEGRYLQHLRRWVPRLLRLTSTQVLQLLSKSFPTSQQVTRNSA